MHEPSSLNKSLFKTSQPPTSSTRFMPHPTDRHHVWVRIRTKSILLSTFKSISSNDLVCLHSHYMKISIFIGCGTTAELEDAPACSTSAISHLPVESRDCTFDPHTADIPPTGPTHLRVSNLHFCAIYNFPAPAMILSQLPRAVARRAGPARTVLAVRSASASASACLVSMPVSRSAALARSNVGGMSLMSKRFQSTASSKHFMLDFLSDIYQSSRASRSRVSSTHRTSGATRRPRSAKSSGGSCT